MCQLIKTQGSAAETITLDKLAAFGFALLGANVSLVTLYRCYCMMLQQTYDAGSPNTTTTVQLHIC